MSYDTKLLIIILILSVISAFSCMVMFHILSNIKTPIPTRPNRYKSHSPNYIAFWKKHFITPLFIQSVNQSLHEKIRTENVILTVLNNGIDRVVTFKFTLLDGQVELPCCRTYDDIYECCTSENLTQDVYLEFQKRLINHFLKPTD